MIDVPATQKHSFADDTMALILGPGFVALGLAIYQQAMLLMGSSAGIALLINYATGYSFGIVFFVINLPFWYLSVKRMGWTFTIRTFLAMIVFSLMSRFTPDWIGIGTINPVYAAVSGGALMGTGLLILFRHRAALGGFNVLALYLQDNYGIRAGYFSLAVDLVVMAMSFLVLDRQQVMLSVLGAVVLNLVIAMNHRQGRYVGMS